MLLIAISAFSQVPPPKGVQAVGSSGTEKKEKKASSDKTDTGHPANSPTQQSVESERGTPSPNKPDNDTEQNRRIADYTAQLAFYTKALVWVGIFQILVFIAQAVIFRMTLLENRRLIKATGKLAHAASRSAKTSERTLYISQQPLVTVTRSALLSRHTFPTSFSERLRYGQVEIGISNTGITVALDFYYEIWFASGKGSIPLKQSKRTILQPNQSVRETLEWPDFRSGENITLLENAGASIAGFIRYKTVFPELQENM